PELRPASRARPRRLRLPRPPPPRRGPARDRARRPRAADPGAARPPRHPMSDSGAAGEHASAAPGALPEGVTRPIPDALLALALPALASFLLRIAYQWVDALWVRPLGVHATAAVTTSVFVMWSVYSVNDVFAIGVTAFVSQ